MTTLQLDYLKSQETERSNRAKERISAMEADTHLFDAETRAATQLETASHNAYMEELDKYRAYIDAAKAGDPYAKQALYDMGLDWHDMDADGEQIAAAQEAGADIVDLFLKPINNVIKPIIDLVGSALTWVNK